MSNTMQEILARKSVRVFEDRPVEEEKKQSLIEAALQAPTAGNQILYTMLDIQDQKIKDRLAVTCDDQPFIARAPVVFIFLADCRRWLDAYEYAGAKPRKPGTGDLLLACADAFIAAQNTVVAAESLGLGSCYIGDILEHCEEHRALLHLDEYTVPACMVVYGYPTQQQKERKKPKRFNREYIVQKDHYRRLDERNMRAMFDEAEGGKPNYDFDSFVRAFCERKYNSDFSREMSRSANAYLRAFAPEE